MVDGHSSCPKVAGHYLLESMKLADISKVYIVLRKGKWDIPAYFGSGKMIDLCIASLMMDLPFGVPYTLDQAFCFIQDAIVAEVTRKASAVCFSDQPRAARSSRIAMRS